MRKVSLLLLLFLFTRTLSFSQNPETVFETPVDTINLACGATCTSITTVAPHIKQTNDYLITNPLYKPFAYTTPGGTEDAVVYIDDHWGDKVTFPFGFFFCFYGVTYPGFLLGSNSGVTFDTSLYNQPSGYVITAATTIPNSSFAKAMIFGPWHDIDPSITSAGRKVEWRQEGVAPKRRYIISYNQNSYYGTSCTAERATHQIVMYENTGIVEVYIKDKPACTGWNQGRAILGVQDFTRTRAVAAPGKNATVWGTNGMDSCFRFLPSSGSPTYKRSELLLNNAIIATATAADTSTSAPGKLRINFPNICPPAANTITQYVVRVVYGSCNNPNIEVSFNDTIFVKKAVLAATLAKVDATCSAGGTITVTATGAGGPLQYSLIGNTTVTQSSNVFSNVAGGSYTVRVSDGGTCPVNIPVTINVTGAVTVNAGIDTTICPGASFTRTATASTTTGTYAWTPATGVSNPAIAGPVFTPTATTTYTVTVTNGACSANDAFIVTVAAPPAVNAGPDAFVSPGQAYTMQATAAAGSYVWTPATGLSSATILNPTVTLQATTTYQLQVTTQQGCRATDAVTLTLLDCIKPMEAFTPNGDGINDLWIITNGACLKTANVQVFNRYGAKVYESKDYRNNFDGTYKGKPLADGTYYFVILYTLVNGEQKGLKGSLTILR